MKPLAPTLGQIVNGSGSATGRAEPMYELAIYGLGPGGLIAAVNGASERLRQVLVGCFSI